MNNVFDINRFGKLFAREFNSYKTKLMWVAIAAIGLFVLTVIYGYIFHTEPFNFNFTSAAVVLTILAPIFFFKDLSRVSSILDFTLPASTFEKFLVKWSFSIFLMPVFVIGLLLLLAGLYSVLPGGLSAGTAHRILYFLTSLSFEEISAISAFQSFFLVGVFFFRKHVFLRVSLSLIFYFILFILTFVIFHQDLFDRHGQLSLGLDQSGNLIYSDSSNFLSFFRGNRNLIIYFILNLIAPFGLWVVSFLKLRETEI